MVPVGGAPEPERVAVKVTGQPRVAESAEVWTLTVEGSKTVKEWVTGGAAA
jgi:hypothetical protein